MTKKIIRRQGDPSPAKKAAATKKRKKLEAAATKAEKPDVEKPDVTVTPYPRTGDNKNFEDVLDNVGSADGRPVKMPATQYPPDKPPAVPAELLTAADVAEWVAWPFLLWAQSNDLDSLQLSAKEATSVAEPLTTILNRHGATKYLPPDAIDGLKVAARITPILSDRFAAIKAERARRAAAGKPAGMDRPGPTAPAPVQGATATKPREV